MLQRGYLIIVLLSESTRFLLTEIKLKHQVYFLEALTLLTFFFVSSILEIQFSFFLRMRQNIGHSIGKI